MNAPLTEEKKLYPIQTAWKYGREQALVGKDIYMAAYEVYSHVYGPQQAMIEGGCRGGFGMCELIAFLYARPFPREQWRHRVDECFAGNIKGFS